MTSSRHATNSEVILYDVSFLVLTASDFWSISSNHSQKSNNSFYLSSGFIAQDYHCLKTLVTLHFSTHFSIIVIAYQMEGVASKEVWPNDGNKGKHLLNCRAHDSSFSELSSLQHSGVSAELVRLKCTDSIFEGEHP